MLNQKWDEFIFSSSSNIIENTVNSYQGLSVFVQRIYAICDKVESHEAWVLDYRGE